MNLTSLLPYFDTSPALRLLRSPNAPFILDFLDGRFKQAGRITIPHSELLAELSAYCERLRQTHPDALRDKPETYLAQWCSSDSRWLHRFLPADAGEPVYELTPHTEDVFAFLDRVLQRDQGFVGTESRLHVVIDTLADLSVQASDDPEVRLAHLRSEKLRIEHEMAGIEREGLVTRYRPAQIRERFATAILLLKQLEGDFRAVEEKFRQITRQVQQRHSGGRDSRGEILEFALDAEDVLKREDQGASFYEFVRFLLSPEQQERLQTAIHQLRRVEELAGHDDEWQTLEHMLPLLLAEAEKVMRTNQRLSATLRRLLDGRAARERQRLAALLQEIRGLALRLADDPPGDSVGLDVETKAALSSPFARTFWSEPPQFETIDLVEHLADDGRRADAFSTLAQLQRLDWRTMRSRVDEAVALYGSVTLGDLLAEHPPEAGVVEVLGYMQIARDDGHVISGDAAEEIVLPPARAGEAARAVHVPLVRFMTL